MSQQQAFSGGNSPTTPDIEFIQGTSGAPAGPNPATFTFDFTSSTGDFEIETDPVSYSADFRLANKFEGTGTTIGAVTENIITIPLGVSAGTFQFEARVKAFESTNPAGAGYNIYATFTTDGASATLVGNQPIFNENPVLEDGDAYFVASGNNAVLQVLGVAGLTINWAAETEVT